MPSSINLYRPILPVQEGRVGKRDRQGAKNRGRNVSEKGDWRIVVDVNRFRGGLGRIAMYLE